MADLLTTADKLFTGEVPIEDHHPFATAGELAEITNRTAFVSAFANSAVLATDAGLVMVDTSGVFHARAVHDAVRAWTPARLDTAVFTHGHIDHVFGVELYEADAETNGDAPPRVVAHEAINRRFDRYITTAGYNAVINQRQFRSPGLRWPTVYRRPDAVYRDAMQLRVGGELFELHHARGETDDGTWVWAPERKVVCPGDLFIWASPNCGNPQKVQRYAAEWAQAFRVMAALGAEVMLPGHGMPILGSDRIRTALLDGAELLESLLTQTLAVMNSGGRLDDAIHTVRAPDALLEKPYLRPIYDEPEFVVRGIWRYYGGWWDGNPATLKPASDAAVASEIAALAGGATVLAARAAQLANDGDLRLAGHLAELAALAAPDDAGVHRTRSEVFGARAKLEASTMSKGVFSWTEHESAEKANGGG